jgi:hypothetical protein
LNLIMKSVTNSSQITRLVLRGYKSIAECEIELGRINVLTGAEVSPVRDVVLVENE